MNKITEYLEKKVLQAWNALTPAEREARSQKLDTQYLGRPNSMNHGKKAMSTGALRDLQTNPGQFVYQSEIIRKKAYFYQNPTHREIVHQNNAILSAASKKIEDAVCSLDPKFIYPPKEDDEEEKVHKKSMKVWKERRGLDAFRKALHKSIRHGIVLYEPLDVDESWYTNSPFFVRSWDEILEVMEYNLGFPVLFDIHPTNENMAGYRIDIRKAYSSNIPMGADDDSQDENISTGFFFDPDNTDDHDGNPWFLGAWDNVIDYEIIKEARNSYDQIMGNGIPIVGIPAKQYEKVKSNVVENLKNIRHSQGLVIPIEKDHPVEIKFMASDAARVDFNADLNDIRRDIIANIGFPERWLFGDSEGSMESSGKDRMQVHDAMKNIFNKWKRFMLLFLKYHGAITSFDDIEIVAPYELQLTEREKVEIREIEVSTLMLQETILTKDELREKLGYPPMTPEQEEELNQMEQLQQATPPNGDPNDMDDKTNEGKTQAKEEKKTDTKLEQKEEIPYLLVDSFIQNTPYNDLKAFWKLSKDTIGKIKRNSKENVQINEKTDSILLDSAQIGPDMYMSSGLIVPTQKKYYPEYNATFIRSPIQLKEAFKRHKTDKFPIGVYPSSGHDEGTEVGEFAQFGEVVMDKVDEQGIHGTTIYDLTKVDEILGPQNWIRKRLQKQMKINTSVGLKSTDIPIDAKTKYEINHKIKSFVATQFPRNEKAGVD